MTAGFSRLCCMGAVSRFLLLLIVAATCSGCINHALVEGSPINGATILPLALFANQQLPLQPNTLAANHMIAVPVSGLERKPVLTQADFNYEDATLSEDTTWRGTVMIRGSLVVSAQATLRIEPGTTVRFVRMPSQRQAPRLVVLGRLQVAGTAERSISFGPNFTDPSKADWGGIVLLSSEKRNVIDYCRIEGAEIALAAHFSTFSARGLTVSSAVSGILSRDSIVNLNGVSISNCDSGLDLYDSEVELREGGLSENLRGINAERCSLAISQLVVKNSDQQGVLAEDCRFKISSSEFSSNNVGVRLKGGEGQIILSRFKQNRQIALHLSGARAKVQRSIFADNLADGIQTDDGRAVVFLSGFSNNGGYNLINNGREDISAIQNWWGTNSEDAILAKLRDAAKDSRFGQVEVTPWLRDKPAGMP